MADEQPKLIAVKRVRRQKVNTEQPLTLPVWFDEVPPPWQQAWSKDDTPVGYQLASERAKAAAAD